MLFNSLVFAVFLPTFLVLWKLMPSVRSGWVLISAASLIFYGWWDWRFCGLLLLSGAIDFYAALAIARDRAKSLPYLMLSLGANLGILGFFKYSNFALASVSDLCAWLGHPQAFTPLSIVLPVGISFYTFQSMSYTIDVYYGDLEPTHDPFHFFGYLSMFPQLVAGPIVRARDLLPQLATRPQVTWEDVYRGTRLICRGFFKKVVIADTIAPAINQAFSGDPTFGGGLYWWTIMTLFAFQIYFDFSGYSDIACGIARWMGYEFPRNFDHPYSSKSMGEFWSRWHISLSSWFRDYLYIPLGGSRVSPFMVHRNLWITMLASGLWHGAAWTFVVWGALHAGFSSIERVTQWPKRLDGVLLGGVLKKALVVAQVWLAWVFFRAESMAQASEICKRMLIPWTDGLRGFRSISTKILFWLVVALAIEACWNFRRPLIRKLGPRMIRNLEPLWLAALAYAAIFLRGASQDFIYFQF